MYLKVFSMVVFHLKTVIVGVCIIVVVQKGKYKDQSPCLIYPGIQEICFNSV